MDRHGRNLAGSHRLRERAEADRLLARLSDNQAALDRTSHLLAEAANAGRRLAPAEEWLLDNIYVIREQVGIARRHLPRGYSRELPQLAEGASRGRPRVYDIALERFARHGRVDRRGCAGSSPHTRVASRCRSASCGRSRSCCGWR